MGLQLFDDITVESVSTKTGGLTSAEQLTLSMDALTQEMMAIDVEFDKIQVGELSVEAIDAMAGVIENVEGGISGATVDAMAIGFEHICSTLNYKPETPVFAATTDYDDVNKRGELSVEAVGALKSIGTKVLGAIINTVKKLTRKIVTFIGNWMVNGEKLKKAADDVLDSLKDVSDDTAGTKDLDLKAAASAFDGKSANMESTLNAAKDLLNGAVGMSKDISAAADLIDDGKVDQALVTSLAAAHIFNGAKPDAKYVKAAFGDIKDTTFSASVPVSGKALVFVGSTKYTGSDKDKTSYMAKVKVISVAKASTAKKIAPATSAQITASMGVINGVDFDKMKDLRKELDDASAAIDKGLTAVIADLRKNDKSKGVKGKKLAANALVQLIGVVGSKPLGMFASAAKSAIALSNDSISAMGKSGE